MDIFGILLIMVALPFSFIYFFVRMWKMNASVNARNTRDRIAKYNWVWAQEYEDKYM